MINGAIFEELILYSVILVLLVFPYMYILLKKGSNKFLFCSSCIGAMTLIILVLYAFIFPFAIVFVKVIPQLAEYGQIDYILPILQFAEFIQSYYLVVLFPLLNLVLPILLFRRYALFRKEI